MPLLGFAWLRRGWEFTFADHVEKGDEGAGGGGPRLRLGAIGLVMQRKGADEKMRARRWESFRRRADYAPQNVYRHRTRGLEYVPVHPFGDEVANLERLGLRSDQCWGADAWWGIDGDATLLESAVASVARRPAGLYVKPTPHWERWVYLVAIFDAAFVTREAFEDAMCRFVEAGFPRAPQFRLGRCRRGCRGSKNSITRLL